MQIANPCCVGPLALILAQVRLSPELAMRVAIGFPIFFVAVWLGTFALIARIGGWSALAKVYPASSAVSGKRFGWRSARFFRFGGYNNCLVVTLGDNGIHMIPLWLFSFHHPAILLPWSAVRSATETGLGWKQCAVEIVLPERTITIYLPTAATGLVKQKMASGK